MPQQPTSTGARDRPAGGRYARAMTTFAIAAFGALACGTVVMALLMHHVFALTGLIPVAAIVLLARRRPQWFAGPSRARWLLGIIVLAAGVRVCAVTLLPYEPHADFAVYHLSGLHMARHWEFAYEATGISRYHAFYPPMQPLALGVMYRLFNSSVLSAQMLNVVWSTLTVVCVWYLGWRLFGKTVGRAAGLLAALQPSSVFGCMLLGAEAPEAFWLAAALCVYVGALEHRGRLRAAFYCGLLLGIGSLVRPTYALLPVVLGVHLLLTWPGKIRALCAGALAVCGLAIALAPWTVRNYLVLGEPVPLSTSGGGNLYSANNPQAAGAYTQEAWVELYAAYPNDEIALDRMAHRKAWAWIADNPGRFAALAAMRAGMYWYTDKEIAWWALEEWAGYHPQRDIGWLGRETAKGASSGFYAAAFVAAYIGARRWRRRLALGGPWLLLPLMAVYFTMVHMVFESQCKYHYMLVPLLMIPAALACASPRPEGSAGGEATEQNLQCAAGLKR